MKQHTIKTGNVGTLTNGVLGMWRVIAVDGNTLTLELTTNTLHTISTMAENFWCLLDEFNL
jgi:hypothetical protein